MTGRLEARKQQSGDASLPLQVSQRLPESRIIARITCQTIRDRPTDRIDVNPVDDHFQDGRTVRMDDPERGTVDVAIELSS